MSVIETQKGRRVAYYIFRAWIIKNDVKYWAKDYGYKAWRIPIYAG